MAVKPSEAQDVWKDAGENVLFEVFKLKRQDQAKEQGGIQEFVSRFQAVVRSMRIRADKDHLKTTLGFSSKAWDYLFPDADKPKELEDYQTLKGPKYEMPATAGDIFIHLRADRETVVYEMMNQLRPFLSDYADLVDETKGFRYFEGRAIIGFIDGTENPMVEEAANYAIIGDEDPEFENGSYAFAQKWRHHMDIWDKLTTETQEKAVGRKKFSDLELEDGEKFKNAHNVASQAKINGVEQKIVRMNVPFSDPASGNTGTYFIGYSRHWDVTKLMLKNMLAKNDYLLTFSDILGGQLFFIPSRPLLTKIGEGEFH